MSLPTRLAADLKSAMKSQDTLTRDVVRMLKADLTHAELSRGRPLTADEEVAVLERAVKTRRESVDAYKQGGNAEAARREEDEVRVVERYLPVRLDEAAIEQAITKLVDELQLSGKGDLGKLMKVLKERYAGQVDMGLASKLAATALVADR